MTIQQQIDHLRIRIKNAQKDMISVTVRVSEENDLTTVLISNAMNLHTDIRELKVLLRLQRGSLT